MSIMDKQSDREFYAGVKGKGELARKRRAGKPPTKKYKWSRKDFQKDMRALREKFFKIFETRLLPSKLDDDFASCIDELAELADDIIKETKK